MEDVVILFPTRKITLKDVELVDQVKRTHFSVSCLVYVACKIECRISLSDTFKSYKKQNKNAQGRFNPTRHEQKINQYDEMMDEIIADVGYIHFKSLISLSRKQKQLKQALENNKEEYCFEFEINESLIYVTRYINTTKKLPKQETGKQFILCSDYGSVLIDL